MSPLLAAILLLAGTSAEESDAPEQFLKPRNFNPHPYDKQDVLISKFYQHLNAPEPTQQGPVLFPNDSSPPPKPPLIVTSRPLSESISRSELSSTPEPLNNTLAQPSYLSRVQAQPNFAPINFYRKPSRLNLYRPLANYENLYDDSFPPYRNGGSKGSLYPEADSPYPPNGPTADPANHYKNSEINVALSNFYKKPILPVNGELGKHNLDAAYYEGYEGKSQLRYPYASLLKKSRLLENEGHRYNDYEEQTILPPIYKALSEHARQNVLRTAPKPVLEHSEPRKNSVKDEDSSRDYNDYSNDIDKNSDYGKKYAFSYSVRDHKTGDDFSHSQRSSGAATNGEYRVRLPDGRMQIVSYVADEGGYRADVKYAEDDVKPVDNSIDSQPKPRDDHIPTKTNEDYHNRFDSKEYYNDDYEYGNKAQFKNGRQFENPTTFSSKFGPIVVPNNEYSYNRYSGVTGTPSYDNTVLITPTKKPFYALQSTPKYKYDGVHFNVPSTTPSPNYSFRPNSFANTERLVHIGGSTKSPLLYTNIHNRLSNSGLSQVSLAVPVSTITPLYKSQSVSPLYDSSTLNPLDGGNQKSYLKNFVNSYNKYLRFQ